LHELVQREEYLQGNGLDDGQRQGLHDEGRKDPLIRRTGSPDAV
jgi:hypothetical protein